MKRSHEQNQTLRVTSCSFVDRFCFPPIVQTYPVLDATRLAYAADSGITVYGSKTTRFLYEVTNSIRDGRGTPSVWDTTNLPRTLPPVLDTPPWFPKVVGKSNIDHPSSKHSSTLLGGPQRR